MSTPVIILLGLGIVGIVLGAFVLMLDRYSTRHAHRRP